MNKKSPVLTLLLVALSSTVGAGCKSDCREEYEAEMEFCKSSYSGPNNSEMLTRCIEGAKSKFPVAAGTGAVYRCLLNDKPVFTDRPFNSLCKALNIQTHSADPAEVARQLEENRQWAEKRGEFLHALEAEQAAAQAERLKALESSGDRTLVSPYEAENWIGWPTWQRRRAPINWGPWYSTPPYAFPAPDGIERGLPGNSQRNPPDNFQRNPPDNFQRNPPWP